MIVKVYQCSGVVNSLAPIRKRDLVTRVWDWSDPLLKARWY
jgi:hypothetical protein